MEVISFIISLIFAIMFIVACIRIGDIKRTQRSIYKLLKEKK